MPAYPCSPRSARGTPTPAGAPCSPRAFATAGAPLGTGPPAPGISTDGIPVPAPASGGARTHYAFDSAGEEGTVRIVVIDNAAGSLAASDAAEGRRTGTQTRWLRAVLVEARERHVPAIVVGTRPLTTDGGFDPAADGEEVARLLVDEGASAYVSSSAVDDPADARFGGVVAQTRIPGEPGEETAQIPAFTTGGLGHLGPRNDFFVSSDEELELPGDFRMPSELLLEVDPPADPESNRAEVRGLTVPLIDRLWIQDWESDSTIRRDVPTFFPAAGQAHAIGGFVEPKDGLFARGDSYVDLSGYNCFNRCPTVDVTYTSSNRAVGYFAKLGDDGEEGGIERGPDGLPLPDPRSPVFCGLANGTTTLTVSAGGLSASTTVTVVDPPPARPPRPTPPGRTPRREFVFTCGEVPAAPAAAPTPAVPPAAGPFAQDPAPAPPGGVPEPPPSQPPQQPSSGAQVEPAAPILAAPAPAAVATPPGTFDKPPVASPKPPPPPPPPQPPSGTSGAPAPVSQPVTQQAPGAQPVAQPQREQERRVADDSAQAAARYVPGSPPVAPSAPLVLALIVLAATGGTAAHRATRGRPAPQPAWAPVRRDPPFGYRSDSQGLSRGRHAGTARR